MMKIMKRRISLAPKTERKDKKNIVSSWEIKESYAFVDEKKKQR